MLGGSSLSILYNLGFGEILYALKVSMTRDFGWFPTKNGGKTPILFKREDNTNMTLCLHSPTVPSVTVDSQQAN